jgi:hypothetical protein
MGCSQEPHERSANVDAELRADLEEARGRWKACLRLPALGDVAAITEVTAEASDLYLDVPNPDANHFVDTSGEVKVEVDGVAVPVGRGIPNPLGRLPAGARIHVEMSSGVPDTMPFIGLSLGRGGSLFSTYDVFAFCEEPGCVATADGVVDGCLN